MRDPLAAIVFCQPPNVDLPVINGPVRVEGGQLLRVDLPVLVERHNRLARALVEGSL